MNQLTIIGNLTKDPETRLTQSGKDVTAFTVAVNTKFGDKQNTDYFRVTAWNGLAKACSHLTKGAKVCVVGDVHLHQYDLASGKTGAILEVTAGEVEFLSPKATASADEWQDVGGDLPF